MSVERRFELRPRSWATRRNWRDSGVKGGSPERLRQNRANRRRLLQNTCYVGRQYFKWSESCKLYGIRSLALSAFLSQTNSIFFTSPVCFKSYSQTIAGKFHIYFYCGLHIPYQIISDKIPYIASAPVCLRLLNSSLCNSILSANYKPIIVQRTNILKAAASQKKFSAT